MTPFATPARKRFGQHFLRDTTAIRRIIDAVRPEPGQPLVEIGPGRGALTRHLLQAALSLEVVELDRDLIAPLLSACRGLGELRIHQADALTFDFSQLRHSQERLRLVGNLPYNIATPLIFHLLDQLECIADMHFMLQKEVVERMAASPGSKAYGRLSVMLQYRCRVEPLFTLGAAAFSPPPRVESAFVRLLPHDQAPVDIGDPARFAALVQRAFSQRRKTLRNVLRDQLAADRIAAAGIDPGARPETLSLADFAALSRLSA